MRESAGNHGQVCDSNSVTFLGAPEGPVTIDAPTQAEAGLYNGVGEGGIWALVVEKAFGKYLQDGASSRYPYFERGAGNTPVEGGSKGADLCSTVELLTGNRAVGFTTSSTLRSHLRQELEDAFKSAPPRVVTAGTSRHPISEGKSGTTEDGFATTHAYSVIGFDLKGPGGGTVTIRNPWGDKALESTRGTIKITLDQFRKNFTDMAVEGRK